MKAPKRPFKAYEGPRGQVLERQAGMHVGRSLKTLEAYWKAQKHSWSPWKAIEDPGKPLKAMDKQNGTLSAEITSQLDQSEKN